MINYERKIIYDHQFFFIYLFKIYLFQPECSRPRAHRPKDFSRPKAPARLEDPTLFIVRKDM